MTAERRGWIPLYQGSIIAETASYFLVPHESDWADRKCGDERRMLKRNVAVKP
jgi:hypothetical protein